MHTINLRKNVGATRILAKIRKNVFLMGHQFYVFELVLPNHVRIRAYDLDCNFFFGIYIYIYI